MNQERGQVFHQCAIVAPARYGKPISDVAAHPCDFEPVRIHEALVRLGSRELVTMKWVHLSTPLTDPLTCLCEEDAVRVPHVRFTRALLTPSRLRGTGETGRLRLSSFGDGEDDVLTDRVRGDRSDEASTQALPRLPGDVDHRRGHILCLRLSPTETSGR
jgi:hypothetical protein